MAEKPGFQNLVTRWRLERQTKRFLVMPRMHQEVQCDLPRIVPHLCSSYCRVRSLINDTLFRLTYYPR
jgi:hypothetical protein